MMRPAQPLQIRQRVVLTANHVVAVRSGRAATATVVDPLASAPSSQPHLKPPVGPIGRELATPIRPGPAAAHQSGSSGSAFRIVSDDCHAPAHAKISAMHDMKFVQPMLPLQNVNVGTIPTIQTPTHANQNRDQNCPDANSSPNRPR